MKHLCLLLLLVLCGCGLNPRTTAPVYETPESRAVAARHLNEALAQGGRGLSEVHAGLDTLKWHEMLRLTDKRQQLISRELELRQVRGVYRPERDSVGWRLTVDATGGRVVFLFKDSTNAAKAEAAFTRLKQVD